EALQATAKLDLTESQTAENVAQTDKAEASTAKIKTSDRILKMSESDDKKAAVQNLKDYNDVARLRIATADMMKNLKPYKDEDPSEGYLDMQQLLEELKIKQKEIEDRGKTDQPEKKQAVVNPVAKSIEDEIIKTFPRVLRDDDTGAISGPSLSGMKGSTELAALRINQYASSLPKPVNVDFNGIKEALVNKGFTIQEIIAKIDKMASQTQQPQQQVQQQQPQIQVPTTPVGSSGAPVPIPQGAGGRIAR
ncbi:MAG: hypothetical protein ACTSRU_21675, partial [Candidatus Hodarchaeales archaeon]